jgi:hypothetical protein
MFYFISFKNKPVLNDLHLNSLIDYDGTDDNILPSNKLIAVNDVTYKISVFKFG